MYISEFHMYVSRVAVLSHDSFALLGHVMCNVMYCKGDIDVCTYTLMYAYLHHCIYWLYCGCSWVGLSMLSVSNVLTMLKCHLEELAQNEVYFVHWKVSHGSCSCNKTCFRPTTHCDTTASCNTSASSPSRFAGSYLPSSKFFLFASAPGVVCGRHSCATWLQHTTTNLVGRTYVLPSCPHWKGMCC